MTVGFFFLIEPPAKDGRNDGQGFKGLWKKVKPFDKPEEVSHMFLNLNMSC